MPWILSLLAGLASAAFLRALIIRALVLLGVGAVSFVGFNALWEQLRGYILTAWGQLPADLATILHLAAVDRGLSIILSAYAVRLAFMALSSAGVLKKVLWRPGSSGSVL